MEGEVECSFFKSSRPQERSKHRSWQRGRGRASRLKKKLTSDFPPAELGERGFLNFIVTGLQDIDKCRQQLHDITVPLEVFEYIDQGRNPQLYTKECLERALAKNEQVKGKIDTMKKFKSLLIQELSKVFPEDMAKYRSIRGEDHPPS
uniref:Mediator of RNA polymerase II transcription subunit 10 n=1 Tax=Marmota marmota marmota TaxID=9994 RepID=A0A8C5ZV24_MARMA